MNSLRRLVLPHAIVFLCAVVPIAMAQNPPARPGPGFGPGGPGGPGGGGGPMGAYLEVVVEFDRDGDGLLNASERRAAREFVQQERAKSPRRGRFGPRGESGDPGRPGPRVSVEDVRQYADESLYDESVLRTIFLQFENDDWESELSDFYNTDVEIPARMTVDGLEYPDVGVSFRGSSSYFTVGAGSKRSLNLSIDYADKDQRLLKHRTLDLLNSHTDPTFLRTVLFNHIARDYIPTPRANFVKLVVNGESWGIYINAQQFNRDFLGEWFDSSKGARWKLPGSPRAGGGLAYLGDDVEAYKQRYEIKTNDPRAWKDLIVLCKTLNETPPDRLEDALRPILDVDGALWFLALENVFIDNDGYWIRASDFNLFQDNHGRFHIIPHDSNETFRLPGGPGFGGGGDIRGIELDPLFGEDDEGKPLIHRLFAVPSLKARYLAHVKAIAEEWLDWKRLEPLIRQYQGLIDAEIKADTRKLSSYEAFASGATRDLEEEGFRGPRRSLSLKSFVEQRREYLMSLPAIRQPAPVIQKVSHTVERNGSQADDSVLTTDSVQVTARITDDVARDGVTLYFSDTPEAPFEELAMANRSSEEYVVTLSPRTAGTRVRYYVRAKSGNSDSLSFEPARAERVTLGYVVNAPTANESGLVINEVMASNSATIADPQGQFDDWIELVNVTNRELDLSGMYLSDKRDNPRKWKFPEGTAIPAQGRLLVWMDENGKATIGLHANFKLSAKGEWLGLFDTDDRANRMLDSVEFGEQKTDVSWARTPDAMGGFDLRKPTPAKPND